MTLGESSIYKNLVRLRTELYSLQFCMQKTDRIIYGTPLMQKADETMKKFLIAFNQRENKIMNLDESMAWFVVLRIDLEMCVKKNIIHFEQRKPKKGQAFTEREDYVNSQKVELFKIVAQIENDMRKWREGMTQAFDNNTGKTVIAELKKITAVLTRLEESQCHSHLQ